MSHVKLIFSQWHLKAS